MIMFAIILGSLALLAATAALALTICERKRSLKRNTALKVQLQSDVAAASEGLKKQFAAALEEQSKRIENLEKGMVPDFEKAKAAAQAVNDFNAGISGILGFDPYDALKAQRAENFGGEDG
jgi:phage shock protein A